MKRLLSMALIAIASDGFAAQLDSWFHEVPAELRPRGDAPQLAADHFAEIPASKLQSAEERLATVSLSELKEECEVAAFAPAKFSCQRGERIFLVRALYEYGERGFWEVFPLGADLLVRNSALGPAAPTHRSALVVCWRSKPATVYVEVSGAM
jgi:hypothetical protein